MQRFKIREMDIFVSDEGLEELGGQDYLEQYVIDLNENLEVKQPELEEIMRLYKQVSRLEKIAYVIAHGNEVQKEWAFIDKGEWMCVQDLVDRLDGNYSTLILNVCNPQGLGVESKKSLVLYPNDSVGGFEEDVKWELFMPGKGIIDPYLLESEVRELREQV